MNKASCTNADMFKTLELTDVAGWGGVGNYGWVEIKAIDSNLILGEVTQGADESTARAIMEPCREFLKRRYSSMLPVRHVNQLSSKSVRVSEVGPSLWTDAIDTSVMQKAIESIRKSFLKSDNNFYNSHVYELLKDELISLVKGIRDAESDKRSSTFIETITSFIPFNERIKELIDYHSTLKPVLKLNEINYMSIINFMKYSIELKKVADEKSINYDFDLDEMKVSISNENKTLDLYFTKDGHVNFLFEDKDEDGLTRISGTSFFTKKITSGHKISILLNMVK